MAEVHALLVAVDDYPPPMRSLRGCANDIDDAERYLREAWGERASIRKLVNADATRESVITNLREHLGRAGPGESALFWFAGHGSTAPVPKQWWHLENSGTTMQTLVCVDSRAAGTPDLLDKELALLIGEVAARGAHVVVVLDCCHAGGATRTATTLVARHVASALRPPDPAVLLEQLRLGAQDGHLPGPLNGSDHVALAACHDYQLAYEIPDPAGRHRGAFTLGLLDALRRAGPPQSYRDLIASARCFVENTVQHQTPVLRPMDESVVDQPFLGGQGRLPEASMRMSYVRGEWVVGVGSCHGLPDLAGRGRLAVHGSNPLREALVVRVGPAVSVVKPLGWSPVPGETYPVVLSHVASPRTRVAIVGDARIDAILARAIESSPYLRVVSCDDASNVADLVVSAAQPAAPAIRGADGEWLASPPAMSQSPNDTGSVVRSLEHIARWRQIRNIRNPMSRLAGQVRLEVIAPLPRETRTPQHRPGLRCGASGAIELEYIADEYGFSPPCVFLRLDNLSDRRLYCVVLDLTDRFRSHIDLFPGAFIDPHASAAAGMGNLIELSFPPGRVVKPGASVRDWLMLFVSEDDINSDYFVLPRLDDRQPQAGRDAQRPAFVRDWWTSLTAVVTRVPGQQEHSLD